MTSQDSDKQPNENAPAPAALGDQTLFSGEAELSMEELMAGFSAEDTDYSLDDLSQAYAEILSEQHAIDRQTHIPESDHAAATSSQVSDAIVGDARANAGRLNPPAPPHSPGRLEPANTDAAQGATDGYLADASQPPAVDNSRDENAAAFLEPLSLENANRDLIEDDRVPVTPERIVESILFVGTPDNQPISARLIASLMRGVSPDEVDTYVQRLNDGYVKDQTPYQITKSDLGYRMHLSDLYRDVRNRFYGQIKEVRLSQSVIDTLSVVAYHQPVTTATVERLMSRSASAQINQLVRRDLLAVQKGPEKQKCYVTTERFLEVFGLESLEDLPQSETFHEG